MFTGRTEPYLAKLPGQQQQQQEGVQDFTQVISKLTDNAHVGMAEG